MVIIPLLFHFVDPSFVTFVVHQEALDVVGISKRDQECIFMTLATILWLGNTSFQVTENGNQVEVLVDEGNSYFLGFLSYIW